MEANLSVLNLVIVKKGTRIFLDSLIVTVPHCLGPKKLVESASFSVSPKKMMSVSMC